MLTKIESAKNTGHYHTGHYPGKIYAKWNEINWHEPESNIQHRSIMPGPPINLAHADRVA